MQTILENLEETYLQLEQVIEDDKAGRIQLDTADREAICIAFTNTIKNIVILILFGNDEIIPQDIRVYKSIVHTSTFLELPTEKQEQFMEVMYKIGYFHKGITIGELIEKLQNYDKDCLIQVDGQKFIIDDTLIGKPLVELKTVEQ